jgi:hypothetical protein
MELVGERASQVAGRYWRATRAVNPATPVNPQSMLDFGLLES